MLSAITFVDNILLLVQQTSQHFGNSDVIWDQVRIEEIGPFWNGVLLSLKID